MALKKNTDKQWQRWGEIDPYFAVESSKKFDKANFAQNAEEFWRMGEASIANVLDIAERHFGKLEYGSALDFGCGVGRLVVALAGRYAKVVGVDISDAMLAEARKNCSERSIANAEFRDSDDSLSRVPEKFDLVHTYVVLQHIPPDRGYPIIEQLAARLNPRGCIALHVSVRRRLDAGRRVAYWLSHNVPLAGSLIHLLRGRNARYPVMQMNNYDILTVLENLERAGMKEFVVTLEPHSSSQTVFVIARKGS